MTTLLLYDDADARRFDPFALTRPVSELRAGTELLRARWEKAAGAAATGFIGAAHLDWFEEAGAPAALSGDTLSAGSIVANARFAVALDEALASSDTHWTCDDRVCAVRLGKDVPATSLRNGTTPLEELASAGPGCAIRGRWIGAVWDLLGTLSAQLSEDMAVIGRDTRQSSPAQDVVGAHQVTVEDGASIEKYVVFDASAGPIVVRRGAHISAFTRVVGPCYVGEGATILGDRVANCAIGEMSKIRGEISSSIVLGHSNKGHTGFVGHSYLGRWANLGAGTTTSNLKNTYGTVQMWTPSGLADTGQQFLGTLFGDHAKTGIGTMLNTGTVVGAGANVFGSVLHPKYVPPFAWGDGEPYATFDLEKFTIVAERVMKRRGIDLTERQRAHIARVHAVRDGSA